MTAIGVPDTLPVYPIISSFGTERQNLAQPSGGWDISSVRRSGGMKVSGPGDVRDGDWGCRLMGSTAFRFQTSTSQISNMHLALQTGISLCN